MRNGRPTRLLTPVKRIELLAGYHSCLVRALGGRIGYILHEKTMMDDVRYRRENKRNILSLMLNRKTLGGNVNQNS